jgi:hypothetical protein
MRDKLSRIVLTQGNDLPVWDWTKNGQFTVKSIYKDLSRAGIDRSFKHLWKAKIPLKIKVWLWLIWHNAIATKDTMLERGWTGNPFCKFCRQKNQFSIFSFPALLLNMFGVVLPNLLVLLPGLGIFPNFSGGFLDMSLPVEMFKSLGLQQSAGLFGSFTIDLVLRGS